MTTRISICLILIAIIYPSIISAKLSNVEQQNQKRYATVLFGRYGVDPTYFTNNRRYYDDDVVIEDAISHNKRQSKKKLATFFQQSQSPYTIAFPALIRSRRMIIQEQ